MKTLKDLKAIAGAASESNLVNDAYIDFVKTFTPKLVSALLDEVLANRFGDIYDEAEAAANLDAILRGE